MSHPIKVFFLIVPLYFWFCVGQVAFLAATAAQERHLSVRPCVRTLDRFLELRTIGKEERVMRVMGLKVGSHGWVPLLGPKAGSQGWVPR
jgi:hypothetical protein